MGLVGLYVGGEVMKERSILRRLTLLMGLFILVCLNALAAKESPFFPLSEVQPGMKGVAYTVIAGSKIESFSVKVLGVLAGSGSVKNLILIQVSGSALDGFGGIAAGMSGSPVYIKNKLVGAIGYGFQNADPQYGLVTPIEDMRRLLAKSRDDNDQKLTWVNGGFRGIHGVSLGGKYAGQGWLNGVPVSTPIGVSGLGERAFRNLSRLFPADQVQLFSFGNSKDKKEKVEELLPGSAVGVQLVTGDYEVSAIGTITWVEAGQFLAFGHPFLNKGDVDYYVTGATIYRTIGSQSFPFKLGNTTSVIGRLRQDRSAGIAGVLGQSPEEVPVKISVSENTGKYRTFQFSVVQDETLMKGLIVAGTLEAVDKTLDRVGSGTAEVHLKVIGNGLDTIERTNLFFGPDVAAASLKDLNKLLDVILNNEFMNVRITNVEVEIKISPERKTARILNASIKDGRKFKPGDKFQVEVGFQTYRGGNGKSLLTVTLPDNLPPGHWLLSIHGGNGAAGVDEGKDGEKKDSEAAGDLNKFTSLQDEIGDFLSQPTNNMLVLEAFSLNGESGGETGPGGDAPATVENLRWTTPTGYFLTGESQITFEVTSKS